jgi:hypothetical protein
MYGERACLFIQFTYIFIIPRVLWDVLQRSLAEEVKIAFDGLVSATFMPWFSSFSVLILLCVKSKFPTTVYEDTLLNNW